MARSKTTRICLCGKRKQRYAHMEPRIAQEFFFGTNFGV